MVRPKYLVALSTDARAFLSRSNKALREQIGYDLFLLQQDPHREGTKKLKGKINKKVAYRFRSGDYRIIYHVEDAYVLIDVVKIGPRGSVYE